jgi:hypothetical protein
MDLTELEPWPLEQLGYPLLSGYSIGPRDNRIHTAMTVGAGVSRLTSRYVVSDCTMTLQLTDGEEAYFRWWVHNRINLGNDYFRMPIRTGAGINDTAVRFAPGGIGQSQRAGARWRIQCKLEMVGSVATTLAELLIRELVETSAISLQAATNQLEQTIHEDW